jgi:hypothetical protein
VLTPEQEDELLTYSDAEARELLGHGEPSLSRTLDESLTEEERSEGRRLEASSADLGNDDDPEHKPARRRRLQALFQSALEDAFNNRFEQYWN